MKSPVIRWGSREWRKNMDDLVPDPAHPQAFPSKYPMDLMGRIRVKLCAEDGKLVAYGFGGQRVSCFQQAKSVGFVVTVSSFRVEGVTHGRALLVLDDDDRILLRADGRWETYGAVEKVCRAAEAPSPKHVYAGLRGSSPGMSGTQARHARSGRRPPRFAKAPGYVKLRTYPRGTTLRVLARIVLFVVTAGLGGFIGALPAVALPEWFGAVRTLIGIVGVLLGPSGGLWVAAAITRTCWPTRCAGRPSRWRREHPRRPPASSVAAANIPVPG